MSLLSKQIPAKNLVSIDVLVLLLVAPAYIQEKDAYLVVIALLAYVLLSLWLPLALNQKESSRRNRLSFVFRYTLLLVIAVSVVVVPTLANVWERMVTPVEEDGFSPAYSTLSDSAMQTELALGYLDAGLNPYEERYEDTPLRFYQWLDVEQTDWQDPAYDYFVYFPGYLLLSLPFYKAAAATGILYDQRIVYLLFYVILLFVLPHLVKAPAYGLALVAAVGLNPLFTEPVVSGMNDVVPFLGVVLAVLALTRRRFLWAAFFMGMACALKQYAWFVAPFFILYVWEQSEPARKLRNTALSVAIIGVWILVVALPFFLWAPQAFYTDTLAFPAGRAEILYPIRGFTIGRLLMGVGVIPTFFAPFPFQWLQLLFGLPLLLFLLWYQHKKGVAAMLLAAAVFIFGFGFLSRFFHPNYVGVVTVLAALGVLMDFSGTARV